MPFLKNLRERAKVFVPRLKTNEMAINVPKIGHQVKHLAYRNRQRVNAKRRLTMLHDTAIAQKLKNSMNTKVGMPNSRQIIALKTRGWITGIESELSEEHLTWTPKNGGN